MTSRLPELPAAGKTSHSPAPLIALAGCRLIRPPVAGGSVEVVIAHPDVRSFPLRVSPSFGICFKRGPAHDVHSDGMRLVYPAEAICVRQPGCVWSCEPAAVGFVSIDIAPSLLPRGIIPAPMRFVDPARVPRLAQVLDAVDPGPEPFRLEVLIALLFDSLFAAGALDAEELHAVASRRSVDRLRDFFYAHPERSPSLADLARAVGESKFGLIRSFKRLLGTTPHAYLVRLRVARAQELLAHGLSPGEVALRCGFADQAHLSRHFKRVVGLSPGCYAREVRSSAAVRFPS